MSEAIHCKKIAVGIPAMVLAGLKWDMLLMISLGGTALKSGFVKERTEAGVQQAEPMDWKGKERFAAEKLKAAYLEGALRKLSIGQLWLSKSDQIQRVKVIELLCRSFSLNV